MATTSQSGFQQLPRAQLVGTIIGLQLTLLLAALDQTVVSTAMPKIIEHLGGFSRYTWVTTAYMLCSTISVPIFGKLSDLYGRKWILIGSAIGFVLTSALCGASGYIPWLFGDGMNQLIIFRALQGIAGGSIMALAFTVIGDLFPPADRGKYQGLFSAVFAISSVVGPALGGWLTDYASWRWVFYVNLPVGALAVAALYMAFPHFPAKCRDEDDCPVDYLGIFLMIAFLVPLLIALSWGPEAGWTYPPILGMFAAALVFFVAFIFCELRHREPLIPLSLFKDRTISISCASLFFVALGMFGTILFIPLYVQGVLGLSATKSGTLLTPMMLAMTAGSFASGQLVSRTGQYKRIALTGLTALTGGLYFLSKLSSTTSETQLMVNIIVVGIGLGLLMPVYTLIVQNEAPRSMIGIATSTTQFLRSIGGTVGTAVFGSLVIGHYNDFLNKSLPADLPAKVSALLRDPLQMDRIMTQLSHVQVKNLPELLMHVKAAFIFSIDHAFFIGALLVSCALVINFFLVQKPLRRTFEEVGEKKEPVSMAH